MWAAAKGNTQTVEFLVEKGANLKHEDHDQLNCFDLAVVRQIYSMAVYLYQKHGMRPKTPEFYFEKGLNKNFDLSLFLEYCELDRKPQTIE